MYQLTDVNAHRIIRHSALCGALYDSNVTSNNGDEVRRGVYLVAAAVIVFALSGPSQGAPSVMDHPGGTLEQRRACKDDAMKFCQKEIPDIPRITACMTKNKKNLSALCRAQFK